MYVYQEGGSRARNCQVVAKDYFGRVGNLYTLCLFIKNVHIPLAYVLGLENAVYQRGK